MINGPKVTYLGPEDFHDMTYDGHKVSTTFNTTFRSIEGCAYSFHIYPTEDLVKAYETNLPESTTAGVVAIFVIVSLSFVLYDWIVERRQNKVMTSAMRTGAVVNSLFPPQVRERLMDIHLPTSTNTKGKGKGKDSAAMTPGQDLELSAKVAAVSNVANGTVQAIATPTTTRGVYGSKPIADLFPDSSVLFGTYFCRMTTIVACSWCPI